MTNEASKSSSGGRTRLSALMIMLSMRQVQGFSTSPLQTQAASRTSPLLSVQSMEQIDVPIPSPEDRFHSDMQRVLESRRRLRDSTASSTTLAVIDDRFDRRIKPALMKLDTDGAERVLTMLQHMVEIGVATEESYQIVLQAFCVRGRRRWKRASDSKVICTADIATDLVDQAWKLLDERGQLLSVDTCNLALQAFAVCATPRGQRNYAYQAQSLLHRMEKAGISPNFETLSHIIHAWAWQQPNMENPECSRHAAQALERIMKMDPPADVLLQCMDWVLEARSKSDGTQSAAELAEKILVDMEQIKSQMDDPSSISLPNCQSYSNAILAWSKCHQGDSAQNAENLLLKMLQNFDDGIYPESEPELIAFNGVITAWARIGRPDKAESNLWKMEAVRPKCKNLEPDYVSYNSVLHAHLRGANKQKALERMLVIVRYMEDGSADQPAIEPDGFTYNTLMKGWIQSGKPNSAEEAEKILQKMQRHADLGNINLVPTNRHFNVVINALSKSNHEFAATKAMNLLEQMQKSNNAKPDIISYTSVIECYSKSKDILATQVALKLLKQAKKAYKLSGDHNLMPNLRTYTVVILALTKESSLASVTKARELLTELSQLYEESKDEALKPNCFPFNYVLNCAANCMGTKEENLKAFHIATQTFNEMRKSELVTPDSFTYAFWFKACNNLLPNGELRSKCVVHAFNQCKLDGLVSFAVLKRLLSGTPSTVLSQVIDIASDASPATYRNMGLEDLPSSWSRNAAKK